jgi:hypothetical protein
VPGLARIVRNCVFFPASCSKLLGAVERLPPTAQGHPINEGCSSSSSNKRSSAAIQSSSQPALPEDQEDGKRLSGLPNAPGSCAVAQMCFHTRGIGIPPSSHLAWGQAPSLPAPVPILNSTFACPKLSTAPSPQTTDLQSLSIRLRWNGPYCCRLRGHRHAETQGSTSALSVMRFHCGQ